MGLYYTTGLAYPKGGKSFRQVVAIAERSAQAAWRWLLDWMDNTHAVCFPDADTRFRITQERQAYYLEMALDVVWGSKENIRLINTDLLYHLNT